MARRDRRLDIMKAAERLFTSRRFHEITTDDIAAHAHVGKGTLYRHFKDKDDIFRQVAAAGFDELCDLVRTSVERGATYDTQLREAVAAIDSFFGSRRQLYRMMQDEDGRAGWLRGKDKATWCQRRSRLAAALASVIERGIAAGEVRDDLPAHTLAQLLLGLLRARQRALANEADDSYTLAMVLDFFNRGAANVSADAPVSGGSA